MQSTRTVAMTVDIDRLADWLKAFVEEESAYEVVSCALYILLRAKK
jgi:hypothetical protein